MESFIALLVGYGVAALGLIIKLVVLVLSFFLTLARMILAALHF